MRLALSLVTTAVILLSLFFRPEEAPMASKLVRVLILGAPGSGKGTISERIMKDFNIRHLASGDVLRQHVANKTEYGLKAADAMKQGGLVSDNLMGRLILSELQNIPADQNWLLDGFPRTVTQAEVLDKAFRIDTVVSLNVPFQVIVDRLSARWIHPGSGRVYHTEFHPPKVAGICDLTGEPLVQRDDDKPETVQRRLEVYRASTEPLLAFYAAKGVLVEFKGSYSNEIWPKVHKHLSDLMPAKQYTEYS